MKAQDAAHWANEVILITTTLPLSIVATCRTLRVNTISSSNWLPAHAVFSTMTKSIDISDAVIAQIVPVLVKYAAEGKDEALLKTANAHSSKTLVKKLSTKFLDDISKSGCTGPDKTMIVAYKTTRGIFASNYFTKEARELPTFEENFLKKVEEIASFYEPIADKKK